MEAAATFMEANILSKKIEVDGSFHAESYRYSDRTLWYHFVALIFS